MNDLDAVLAGLDRPMQDELRPLHPHGSVTRAEIAGDDLDQGRLAGAVVAHQSDHLPGVEGQRNVVQCVNGAEMLGDVFQFQDRHAGALPLDRPAGSRLPLFVPMALDIFLSPTHI